MTHAEMIDAAREWLVECFESQADEIAEAAADVIRANVDRFFDGGWASFCRMCGEG